ncbi:hypothetical protein FBU30_002966 [Linnemannia zychae]|nr:hypothetical protein FBU30_002966 [Linnemannia zychae]
MSAESGPNKDVTKNLLKGTAIAGLTGATAGGIIGILKHKPVGAYAFSGGLNASLFGMTFIAFRESFLRLQREKNPYYGLKDSQTMDIDQLWSSTLAGAFTGGILAALSRGAKAVPSGTFMFGVMGMGGQWVLTKINRYRQDKIITTTVPLDALPASRYDSRDSVGTGLLNILPVRKTDVDIYEARLRHKLDLIEKEQAILNEEVQRRKLSDIANTVEEKTV